MTIPGTGYATVMRSVAELYLPDECVIVRTPRVANDSGGWTDGTPTTTTVACRIGPLSGRERALGGQLVEETDAVLTVPDSADIRGSDHITHDGTTYEVAGIMARSERLVQRVSVRAIA